MALLENSFQSIDLSDQYKFLLAYDASLRAADKAGIERALGKWENPVGTQHC